MKYSVIFLGISCLLSSCGGKKVYHSAATTIKYKQDDSILLQQIAKLDDIPFPCQATFISNTKVFAESAEQKRVKFYSQLSLPMVIDFYRRNMEFFGWKEDIPSDDKNVLTHMEEGLLSFIKPDRWCIISIRPEDKKNTLVVVFIGQKNESEQKNIAHSQPSWDG